MGLIPILLGYAAAALGPDDFAITIPVSPETPEGRRRLTWYVDPDGAPRPGIYVAADYERAYSGLHFNCGYLVWFREGAGRYVLTRQETNSFQRGESPATPENIAEARRIGRCGPG